MKVLELMLESAKRRDLKSYQEIDKLVPYSYEYDLFRQSCLCAIKFPKLYNTSISDAEERLRSLNGK